MEMLQASGNNAPPASVAPTMLPIMVIPTALIATGAGPGAGAGLTAGTAQAPQGGVEHYYQLQPTHILATSAEGGAAAAAAAAAAAGSAGVNGELALLQTGVGGEQFPHSIQLQQHPQAVNILCTGTLNRAPPTSSAAATLTATSAATLPRGFQPAAFVTDVESDFEGSECGAGGTTTTCMPHFRFGGCGLQPVQQQQQQQHQDAVVGCGSLSYMMGTLAAGGAMHAGRFAGTLGRNRREGHTKRVSFKGDNLPPTPPPPPAVELDENGLPIPMPMPGGVGGGGCSYMHFDNYMDYQVRRDGAGLIIYGERRSTLCSLIGIQGLLRLCALLGVAFTIIDAHLARDAI